MRVAINGFGRIGRLVTRLMLENPAFDVVAINTSTDAETVAYLLKFDSSQGAFKRSKTTFRENTLIVEGKEIKLFSQREPEKCPWKEMDIDLVIECTGKFTKEEDARKHIEAGAKKVLISAPGKGNMKTIVYNVNHEILTKEDVIVSGASCTTNCLAPVANVLNEKYGIKLGFMTTVHAFTNDQNVLDNSHKAGIRSRRGRAASANIVPASTGAAAAIGLVIPELKGKMDGMALRVPTITGSVIDLVVKLKKTTTVEDINNTLLNAGNETLLLTMEPIVSSDVIGTRYGSVVDGLSTSIIEVDGQAMVKIIAWYDNEMSYTAQLVRTAEYMNSLV